MERRLAAIMALDVVGYSRLMVKDEAGTLEALRNFRTTILNPIVEQHGGRIFKHTGDGALIEFASAIDAVNGACEIQRELLLKAAPAGADQLRLRIGINLGDVVVEDGDIYGDGVNVAARLEGIAQADTILVSGPVYEISNKMLPCRFVFVGSKHLKNISMQVRVYRVEAACGSHLSSIKTLDKRQIVGSAMLAALATAAIVVLHPAWLSPQRSYPPVASSSMAYPLPLKPFLALLAFDFHLPGATDALVARGLSAGVRQRLSERGDLFVIAEHSSFQLPSTLGAAEIARRFGIRYVRSGDYKRDGDNATLCRLRPRCWPVRPIREKPTGSMRLCAVASNRRMLAWDDLHPTVSGSSSKTGQVHAMDRLIAENQSMRRFLLQQIMYWRSSSGTTPSCKGRTHRIHHGPNGDVQLGQI